MNENIFHSEIECTFIEPYTKRLRSLLHEKDKIHIIEKNLQEVEYTVFESLQAGDILFIDSTHVVKTGSDVNYILPLFCHIYQKEFIYISMMCFILLSTRGSG